MIPARFRDWVFVGIMTLLMSVVISLAETLWFGHRGNLVAAWLAAFGRSYLVVVPSALLLAPVAQKATAMLVESSGSETRGNSQGPRDR